MRNFVNGLPNDPSAPHANPVRNMHFPGAGVGGHCLPKDSWLLIHGYREYGQNGKKFVPSILASAREMNDRMPLHMVDLLEAGLNEAGKQLQGATVCVLGYTFLENSDDTRNTPTVPLLKELEKRGVSYRIHDPYVKEDEGHLIEQDINVALQDCYAVILMTKHEEYRSIFPDELKELMNGSIIVDGRNLFDQREFENAGFVFKGIGKGVRSQKPVSGKGISM